MFHTLIFWPVADAALARLERAGGQGEALAAVLRTLAELEAHPFDPRLLTRQFQTEHHAHVRMTSCRHENWHIYWMVGDEPDSIEIVMIANPQR